MKDTCQQAVSSSRRGVLAPRDGVLPYDHCGLDFWKLNYQNNHSSSVEKLRGRKKSQYVWPHFWERNSWESLQVNCGRINTLILMDESETNSFRGPTFFCPSTHIWMSKEWRLTSTAKVFCFLGCLRREQGDKWKIIHQTWRKTKFVRISSLLQKQQQYNKCGQTWHAHFSHLGGSSGKRLGKALQYVLTLKPGCETQADLWNSSTCLQISMYTLKCCPD